MKVLLVNPCYLHPLQRYAGGAIRLMPAPPLGLAYIAAELERAGHAVRILDMVALDLRPADIVPAIEEFRPDVAGIACGMAFVVQNALAIAGIARRRFPSIPIILGGSHATFTCKEIVENCSAIDAVVLGEGERAFPELIRRLAANESLAGLPGICYRDPTAGTIVEHAAGPRIDPLDELPLPARHLLPMEAYPTGDEGTRGVLIASRGCPYRCAYCSTAAFHGPQVRRHGVDRVCQEMELLQRRYQASFVSFADDTLTVSRAWAEDLCQEIRRRALRIPWGCDTRVDLVDRELLREMHSAGCRVIFYGIESAAQETLDLIGKGFSLDRARTAVRWTREAGMQAHVSFIIGLPGETYESTLGIADFVEETGADAVLYNILIAYPGCPLFNHPERYGIRGFSTDWSKSEQMRPMVDTGTMTGDDVRRAYIHLLMHLRQLEQRGHARAAGTYQ